MVSIDTVDLSIPDFHNDTFKEQGELFLNADVSKKSENIGFKALSNQAIGNFWQ